MTLLDAIRSRRSVRTFSDRPVSDAHISALLQSASLQVPLPFTSPVSIRLTTFDRTSHFRPSTYGMIRGASRYFLIAYHPDPASALAAGFRFERLVIEATRLGLGTCWIGATFRHTAFNSDQQWPPGQELRMVCPLGYPATKSIVERISRLSVRADRRKPFHTLFSFTTPDAEQLFGEPLELLRLAPSSTNSQPWRAVAHPDAVHFYYLPASPYAMVDMGIALCHFHIACAELHIHGSFTTSCSFPAPPEGTQYLMSFVST